MLRMFEMKKKKKITRWFCRFSFITMYHNETTNKFSRELPLEHVILQLNTDEQKNYYFEIRTELNIYYCGCKRTRNRVCDRREQFSDKRPIFFSIVVEI